MCKAFRITVTTAAIGIAALPLRRMREMALLLGRGW